MKSKKLCFYITTAIHYSSGLPHIGHAYENILTDVIARYKRLLGYQVYSLTGLDEHGQKISEKASENKYENVQQWTNYIAKKFLFLWKKLDLKYDGFIRTTNKNHCNTVQKIFTKLNEQDFIYLDNWTSLYCVGCEESYSETEAIKKDGKLYCRVGHLLVNKTEPSYFLKLSHYQNWIMQFLKKNINFIIPNNRSSELFGTFLNHGLTDLSISRTKEQLTWGIEIKEDKNHVIYVWIDALSNYLTALGYLQTNNTLFRQFWANPQSEIVHVIGKDICRFHAIYWPIMLKMLDLRLPSHLLVHGWIMAQDGRKMSKSFNNVIDPLELVNDYGSDLVRYYLTKEFLINTDNDFSLTKMQEIYNNDLANTYGNLVNRFVGMINKYANGKIRFKQETTIDQLTKKMYLQAQVITKQFTKLINEFKMHELLCLILELGYLTNKYIDEAKPWELVKNKQDTSIQVFLTYVLNNLRTLTIMLQPVLTKGSKLMIKSLNFTTKQLQYSTINDLSLIAKQQIKSQPKAIYQRH